MEKLDAQAQQERERGVIISSEDVDFAWKLEFISPHARYTQYYHNVELYWHIRLFMAQALHLKDEDDVIILLKIDQLKEYLRYLYRGMDVVYKYLDIALSLEVHAKEHINIPSDSLYIINLVINNL